MRLISRAQNTDRISRNLLISYGSWEMPQIFPKKPLILGCARPLGAHRRETDRLAIDAGVNGIAYPSDEGYEYAEGKGFKLSFANQCCSLIERVL